MKVNLDGSSLRLSAHHYNDAYKSLCECDGPPHKSLPPSHTNHCHSANQITASLPYKSPPLSHTNHCHSPIQITASLPSKSLPSASPRAARFSHCFERLPLRFQIPPLVKLAWEHLSVESGRGCGTGGRSPYRPVGGGGCGKGGRVVRGAGPLRGGLSASTRRRRRALPPSPGRRGCAVAAARTRRWGRGRRELVWVICAQRRRPHTTDGGSVPSASGRPSSFPGPAGL